MLRDYGAGERTRQRYLRPGNGGHHFFFLPLRQGTKTFPSEGVFWNCLMQMGGLQRCFLIRGYHGLARVHERKTAVPEPKVAMMLSLGLIR